AVSSIPLAGGETDADYGVDRPAGAPLDRHRLVRGAGEVRPPHVPAIKLKEIVAVHVHPHEQRGRRRQMIHLDASDVALGPRAIFKPMVVVVSKARVAWAARMRPVFGQVV